MKTRVVHCKLDNYDVYIGRPGPWGNPYSHLPNTLAKYRVKTRQEAIEKYKEWFKTQDDLKERLHELKGKILGCWCKPSDCHGDFLAEMADKA